MESGGRILDRILGISDRTNAALHALALAEKNGGSIPAAAAAEQLGVSPTYLAKILQTLARKNLITSSRGIGGGFSLKKPAAETTCLEVLETLDGPLPRRACLFETPVCATKKCSFSLLCAEIEERVTAELTRITVGELARSFTE